MSKIKIGFGFTDLHKLCKGSSLTFAGIKNSTLKHSIEAHSDVT